MIMIKICLAYTGDISEHKRTNQNSINLLFCLSNSLFQNDQTAMSSVKPHDYNEITEFLQYEAQVNLITLALKFANISE